jgi:hypothetical protein
MRQFLADRHPAIGVNLVGEFAEFKPHVAVGLVEIMFLEFLADHLSLHVEAVIGVKASDSILSLSSQKAVSRFSAGSWI